MDTALLNSYFREYYLEHGQGGTHTSSATSSSCSTSWSTSAGSRPPTRTGSTGTRRSRGGRRRCPSEFIDDLLEVTGGGRARDFEAARYHAILRILRSEGIRRMELLGMVMHTMPADVTQNPMFRLVPLKGARGYDGFIWKMAPAGSRHADPFARVAKLLSTSFKSGGSEGDLMRLNGCKSRAMVDRYADDVANQRALEAKRRKGDMF